MKYIPSVGTEDYFKWRVRRCAQIVSLANEYTALVGKEVLDLGCGEGALSFLLSKDGARVHAVDISVSRLEQMRNFCRGMDIDIRKVLNESLPYPDETFDVIFCFDVIPQVTDYSRSLREMGRCVRKEGHVFVEMLPYYSLISGHHLYTYTLLPAQYLPRGFMKWWLFRKEPRGEHPGERWSTFVALNRITVKKFRKAAADGGFSIVQENFLFKYPMSLKSRSTGYDILAS